MFLCLVPSVVRNVTFGMAVIAKYPIYTIHIYQISVFKSNMYIRQVDDKYICLSAHMVFYSQALKLYYEQVNE